MEAWELGRKRQIATERARKAQAILQEGGYFDIAGGMAGGNRFHAVLASFLVDYFNWMQNQQKPTPLQLDDLQKVVESAFAAHKREMEAISESSPPAA